MVKAWAVATALFAASVPAYADMCFDADPDKALAAWIEETHQAPVVTMMIAVGEGKRVPAILLVGRDGTFAFLVRHDGHLCFFAIGDGVKVLPPPDKEL